MGGGEELEQKMQNRKSYDMKTKKYECVLGY